MNFEIRSQIKTKLEMWEIFAFVFCRLKINTRDSCLVCVIKSRFPSRVRLMVSMNNQRLTLLSKIITLL